MKDDPHLLVTGGDNVPNLYQPGKEGTKAFASLIDDHPEIFRRFPFLPILGNHDREITPRGPKPPDHSVYDIEAKAYREFFALPGDEWRWTLDLPAFDLSLIALDLNHIQDFGTTWQDMSSMAGRFGAVSLVCGYDRKKGQGIRPHADE